MSMRDRDPHPWYGPCDSFGPGGACSECTGVVARRDAGNRSAPQAITTTARAAVRTILLLGLGVAIGFVAHDFGRIEGWNDCVRAEARIDAEYARHRAEVGP